MRLKSSYVGTISVVVSSLVILCNATMNFPQLSPLNSLPSMSPAENLFTKSLLLMRKPQVSFRVDPVMLEKTILESLVEQLTYVLWKSKLAVFNAISAAYQLAAVVVGPITSSDDLTPEKEKAMISTVSGMLQKLEQTSPGLFPKELNFELVAKKVVNEVWTAAKKGNGPSFSSLEDFSPEVQSMLGFHGENASPLKPAAQASTTSVGQSNTSVVGQQVHQTLSGHGGPASGAPPPPFALVYRTANESTIESKDVEGKDNATKSVVNILFKNATKAVNVTETREAIQGPMFIEIRSGHVGEDLEKESGNETVVAAKNDTVRQLSSPVPQECSSRRKDATYGAHSYLFSWDAGVSPQNWLNARNFCRRKCMDLVSLESPSENEFIKSHVSTAWRKGLIKYIWTSGKLCDFPGCDRADLQPILTNGWFWSGSGAKLYPPGFDGSNWGISQPDQREGQESCVAMLNPSVYNEPSGQFAWHDILCSYPKPFVCEDSDKLLSYAPSESTALDLADEGFLVMARNVMPHDTIAVEIVENRQTELVAFAIIRLGAPGSTSARPLYIYVTTSDDSLAETPVQVFDADLNKVWLCFKRSALSGDDILLPPNCPDFPGCDRADLQPILTNGWFWSGSGAKLYPPGFDGSNWGISQPDQREGQESCVAMLNPSVYNEPSGQFAWHDILCSYPKPFVCEDSDKLLSYARASTKIPIP
ncbi:unnamed protein product [Notodromas monacha]|uniref:C-type lectin domain-containing protein n=1 Tax=Notodromas monacha TaxID=399045 RepID=A0A7R9BRV0_9CRUS|nr:unnamed protein product [Notodromas monacha]CAG0919637.1 unnamed protein product [Notodromas monacha]